MGRRNSSRELVCRGCDSLRQAAGTSAGLSVEAFGEKKITVCFALDWAAASTSVSGGEGEITITGVHRGKDNLQQKKIFELLFAYCWSKLGDTFIDFKKCHGFGS